MVEKKYLVHEKRNYKNKTTICNSKKLKQLFLSSF
jgi:hypothetical protein